MMLAGDVPGQLARGAALAVLLATATLPLNANAQGAHRAA
ncbi:MAG: hypothetical protein JWQ97_4151, partial [Phenylobacterium sp.]|nr:hypothetical protein [Phenylobacterium sp.]